MIFEALLAAMARHELLLWDGGMCRFYRRRDGSVTIREILVSEPRRRGGIGRALVHHAIGHATVCRASCPADLPANEFWRALGFRWRSARKLPSGRWIHLWEWRACA